LGYGHNQLLKVVLGVMFTDGIEEVRSQARAGRLSLPSPKFGDSSGQPDMILSLSMILAIVIGFSIQRASICMVKAVAEILTTHRTFMLISFAKTIVWIELVTIPLTWLFPDVRANRKRGN
jgi:hypothetical protein